MPSASSSSHAPPSQPKHSKKRPSSSQGTPSSPTHQHNASSSSDMRWYGYKDIATLCSRTLEERFPLPTHEPEIDDSHSDTLLELSSSGCHPGREEEEVDPGTAFAEWVAYVLYRTVLPMHTVFHALHLVIRLSAYVADGLVLPFPLNPPPGLEANGKPSPPHKNQLHYRLFLSALILCTTYSMDDAYANKSWAIASKFVFDIKTLNRMEFEMFKALDWQLAGDGENITDIVHGYEADWRAGLKQQARLRAQREQERKRQELRRLPYSPENTQYPDFTIPTPQSPQSLPSATSSGRTSWGGRTTAPPSMPPSPAPAKEKARPPSWEYVPLPPAPRSDQQHGSARPSSRSEQQHPTPGDYGRPYSRSENHHPTPGGGDRPSSRNEQHHPTPGGGGRPSSRSDQYHPTPGGGGRPSSFSDQYHPTPVSAQPMSRSGSGSGPQLPANPRPSSRNEQQMPSSARQSREHEHSRPPLRVDTNSRPASRQRSHHEDDHHSTDSHRERGRPSGRPESRGRPSGRPESRGSTMSRKRSLSAGIREAFSRIRSSSRDRSRERSSGDSYTSVFRRALPSPGPRKRELPPESRRSEDKGKGKEPPEPPPRQRRTSTEARFLGFQIGSFARRPLPRPPTAPTPTAEPVRRTTTCPDPEPEPNSATPDRTPRPTAQWAKGKVPRSKPPVALRRMTSQPCMQTARMAFPVSAAG